MLDTIGDRLNQLLKERGRQDRGEAYTQLELFQMLTGKRPGPDGKHYKVDTNKSTLNRIFTDKKQQIPLDVIFAICDMFSQDLRYILRNQIEDEPPTLTWSEESQEVAELMDRMQPSTRQMIVQAARAAAKLEDELLETQKELIGMLYKNINLLENGDRKKVDDYLHRAGHHVGQK